MSTTSSLVLAWVQRTPVYPVFNHPLEGLPGRSTLLHPPRSRRRFSVGMLSVAESRNSTLKIRTRHKQVAADHSPKMISQTNFDRVPFAPRSCSDEAVAFPELRGAAHFDGASAAGGRGGRQRR